MLNYLFIEKYIKMNYLRTIDGMGNEEREEHDYYAIDPKAIKLLLELEPFNKNICECVCGEEHISGVLKANGYNVRES